jgi:hypothetical protein
MSAKKTAALRPCSAAAPQDVVNSNSAFSARVSRRPASLFWVGPPLGNIFSIGGTADKTSAKIEAGCPALPADKSLQFVQLKAWLDFLVVHANNDYGLIHGESKSPGGTHERISQGSIFGCGFLWPSVSMHSRSPGGPARRQDRS